MNLSALVRLGWALALMAAATPVAANTSPPALEGLHSFKVRLTDTTPQGSTSRDVTYVAPDKLRVEIVGSPMVVVAIAHNVWLRGQNGQWQKAQYAPGVDPLTEVRATFDIARQMKGPGVHLEGIARLNGRAVKVYDIDPPAKRGYEGRTTRFWIGADDGYPHRIEQRKGPYVFTAVYSAWNQPLSVSGP
jgi:hypothetical protein